MLSSCLYAKQYHFGAIQGLIEQQVGQRVLPQIYQPLDINITITPLPAKRAQHLATTGKNDGEIMRIYSYGEENPSTIRIPTPYYQLETMAFVRADRNIAIKKKSDLQHFRIAKVRGVKHTNNITRGLTNVIDVDSTSQLMWLVNSGRADVALTNTLDGVIALKRLKIDSVKPCGTALATLDLYHYVHQKHQAIVPTLNQQIIKMKASGELNKLIETAEKNAITRALRSGGTSKPLFGH